MGVDWLITGDEGKKRYPADKKLIEWLWEHPEVREEAKSVKAQLSGGNCTLSASEQGGWTTFFTNKFEKAQKNKLHKAFNRFCEPI